MKEGTSLGADPSAGKHPNKIQPLKYGVGFFLFVTMEKTFVNVIDSHKWESVIEVDLHCEIQKKLNQWRHDYAIMIIACQPLDQSLTYLSIMRVRKTKPQ